MGIWEITLTIIGLILAVSTFKWVYGPLCKEGPKMLKTIGLTTNEPNLIIEPVYDGTKEDYSVWWHINIKNVPHGLWWEGFFPTKSAIDCRVNFSFVPLSHLETIDEAGMWRSANSEKPIEVMDLHVKGETGRIPIVSMYSIRTRLIRESDPSPRELIMEPFKCYVTGVHLLHHRVNAIVLKPAIYEFTLMVRSRGDVLFDKKFKLKVPQNNLQEFTLIPKETGP